MPRKRKVPPSLSYSITAKELIQKYPEQAINVIATTTAELRWCEAVIRVYQDALINIAKLGGACHRNGRNLHDPYDVADRALTFGKSRFWDEVKELPYMVLDVEDDGINTPMVSVNKRKLAAHKKAKK
jgi:hypothetical protein